jgi:hypothetical protein
VTTIFNRGVWRGGDTASRPVAGSCVSPRWLGIKSPDTIRVEPEDGELTGVGLHVEHRRLDDPRVGRVRMKVSRGRGHRLGQPGDVQDDDRRGVIEQLGVVRDLGPQFDRAGPPQDGGGPGFAARTGLLGLAAPP